MVEGTETQTVKSDYQLFNRLLTGNYESRANDAKSRKTINKGLAALRTWLNSEQSKHVTAKDYQISQAAAKFEAVISEP